MTQFVPNFLSHVSAKYYLNWFTARKVITKITGCSAIAERTRCRVRYSFGQKCMEDWNWETIFYVVYLQPLWYNRPIEIGGKNAK